MDDKVRTFVENYKWITVFHISPMSSAEFSNLFSTFTKSSFPPSLEKKRCKINFSKSFTDHQNFLGALEEQVEDWWYRRLLWLCWHGLETFSFSQVWCGFSLSSPEPLWSTSFFSQSPVLCLMMVGRDRQCWWSVLVVWAIPQKCLLQPALVGGLTGGARCHWTRSASLRRWRSWKYQWIMESWREKLSRQNYNVDFDWRLSTTWAWRMTWPYRWSGRISVPSCPWSAMILAQSCSPG